MLCGALIANRRLLSTELHPWDGTMSVGGLALPVWKEGTKNVSYFKHLMCVALPQNRVPLSSVFLESKEHFLDILL